MKSLGCNHAVVPLLLSRAEIIRCAAMFLLRKRTVPNIMSTSCVWLLLLNDRHRNHHRPAIRVVPHQNSVSFAIVQRTNAR